MFKQPVKLLFKQSSWRKTHWAWWIDGGRLHERTFHGIVEQFYCSMVKVKPSAKVITIEPVGTLQRSSGLSSFSAGRLSRPARWK